MIYFPVGTIAYGEIPAIGDTQAYIPNILTMQGALNQEQTGVV